MYKNITVYRCITNINNKHYVSTKSSLSSSVLLSENITDFCLYLFSISSVFTLLIISSTRVLLEEKNFSKSASVNFVISFLRNSTSRDRSSLSLSNALCWDSKSKICGNKEFSIKNDKPHFHRITDSDKAMQSHFIEIFTCHER